MGLEFYRVKQCLSIKGSTLGLGLTVGIARLVARDGTVSRLAPNLLAPNLVLGA